MKNETLVISIKNKIKSNKKSKEQALAKKFFPSYLLYLKHLINITYKMHPKTSFKMTAKLLSIAIRKKLSPNAISFYKKGIKRKFIIDGATFNTFTYGDGPLILMLHGWCSNAARWRVYVNELVNSGYKVMVVDAPGHGTAKGRFLSVFLYAKGIKAILATETKWHTVITHSIAGIIAIAAIGNSDKKHHPTKYIMMNTFANATNILEKISSCLGISEKVVKGSKDMMSKYLDFPLKGFNIHKQYNIMNVKGLLIYDTKDKVVPQKEAAHIINHTKSLQVLKTEGLGHNLKSDFVVKEVVNFVKIESKKVVEFNKVSLCL